VGNKNPGSKLRTELCAHRPAQQFAPATQPEQPLNDFLVRKVNEVGAMSWNELRRLSQQEGYFADVESAEHLTLFNVVKAGFSRQLAEWQFRARHSARHSQAQAANVTPKDVVKALLQLQWNG
jgi:hypothetical protein